MNIEPKNKVVDPKPGVYKTTVQITNDKKHAYLIDTYNAFKGTVVNRASPSLHEAHLKTRVQSL